MLEPEQCHFHGWNRNKEMKIIMKSFANYKQAFRGNNF